MRQLFQAFMIVVIHLHIHCLGHLMSAKHRKQNNRSDYAKTADFPRIAQQTAQVRYSTILEKGY